MVAWVYCTDFVMVYKGAGKRNGPVSPCVRATRGLSRPSLDACSGGFIQAILG